ncbi:hypothetical protein SASPL_101284 [Salvia splendens]|uniref:GOLD domain-containing protein n=1 Tax=Salvia splendens TaxID=180675 RepID=A0A8X8YTP3_SALSN|nr:hypothetical protein SASPL_101284 [Salvia splendens]
MASLTSLLPSNHLYLVCISTLRKLEEAVETVHENLLYLKTRKAEMRTTNEATNHRVALYSLVSLTFCIVVSALQIFYLKSYFQKKKLI